MEKTGVKTTGRMLSFLLWILRNFLASKRAKKVILSLVVNIP